MKRVKVLGILLLMSVIAIGCTQVESDEMKIETVSVEEETTEEEGEMTEEEMTLFISKLNKNTGVTVEQYTYTEGGDLSVLSEIDLGSKSSRTVIKETGVYGERDSIITQNHSEEDYKEEKLSGNIVESKVALLDDKLGDVTQMSQYIKNMLNGVFLPSKVTTKELETGKTQIETVVPGAREDLYGLEVDYVEQSIFKYIVDKERGVIEEITVITDYNTGKTSKELVTKITLTDYKM